MTVTVLKGGKASGRAYTMLTELNEKHGTFLCYSYMEVASMKRLWSSIFPNVKFVNILDYDTNNFLNDIPRVVGLDLAELRATEIYITDFEFGRFSAKQSQADMKKVREELKKLKRWSNDEPNKSIDDIEPIGYYNKTHGFLYDEIDKDCYCQGGCSMEAVYTESQVRGLM